MEHAPLLRALGGKVRHLRDERGWSRRELARLADLSERFLAQVEAGEGNPSVVSLAQIAAAFDTTPGALLAQPARAPVLALLGLRGAGKSTVGKAAARRLRVPFVELDARVEEAAGLSLREMFELHGEEYYQRVERDVLGRLLADAGPVVLATGGGIVAHRESFDLLKRRARTIWLRATPDDHWERVVAQGDHRPMANDPLAQTRLRELLSAREALYREADHTVDTSARPVEAVVADVLRLAQSPELRAP